MKKVWHSSLFLNRRLKQYTKFRKPRPNDISQTIERESLGTIGKFINKTWSKTPPQLNYKPSTLNYVYIRNQFIALST